MAREGRCIFFVLKVLIRLDFSPKGGIFVVGKQFDAGVDIRDNRMALLMLMMR